MVLPPLRHLFSQPPKCYGACIVKPRTAPIQSHLRGAQRHRRLHTTTRGERQQTPTRMGTRGHASHGRNPGRRQFHFRPLLISWSPSASSGRASGVWIQMPTVTFVRYSRCIRQHKRRNHYPSSHRPCSTQLYGHREDETSSHYRTGAQGAHRNPQPDRTGGHLAVATVGHIDHAQTQTRQHRQTPGPPPNDGSLRGENPPPLLPPSSSPLPPPCRRRAESVLALGTRQSKNLLHSTAP